MSHQSLTKGTVSAPCKAATSSNGGSGGRPRRAPLEAKVSMPGRGARWQSVAEAAADAASAAWWYAAASCCWCWWWACAGRRSARGGATVCKRI